MILRGVARRVDMGSDGLNSQHFRKQIVINWQNFINTISIVLYWAAKLCDSPQCLLSPLAESHSISSLHRSSEDLPAPPPIPQRRKPDLDLTNLKVKEALRAVRGSALVTLSADPLALTICHIPLALSICSTSTHMSLCAIVLHSFHCTESRLQNGVSCHRQNGG